MSVMKAPLFKNGFFMTHIPEHVFICWAAMEAPLFDRCLEYEKPRGQDEYPDRLDVNFSYSPH